MSIVIKHRFSGAVLYSTEQDITLAVALHSVDLRYADLRGADLRRADLHSVDLRYADLRGADLYAADLYAVDLRGADLYAADLRDADLRDADLRDADLRYADLRYANLRHADLRDADLRHADLRHAVIAPGFTLAGERTVLRIDALGSEARTLFAYVTKQGVLVQTGCFTGTLGEFAQRVDATHGDSSHGQEYRAAIALIEAHARLWAPTSNAETEA